MPIRIEHQPSPGVIGMAAYASGRGKARQRQRKDLLNFYRDEMNRRERRAAQFRGFSYHAALEGMRQKGWQERAKTKRIQDVTDMWQKNLYEEKVAKLEREEAIEDQEAREAQEIAMQEDRQKEALAEEKRKRAEKTRQGILSGEMVLPDEAQKLWDEAEAARTKALTDRTFDPIAGGMASSLMPGLGGLFGEGGLLDEGRENILSEIDADQQRLLPMAQPKPKLSVDEYFDQETTVKGGIRYGMKADGTPTKLGDEGAAQKEEAARLKKKFGEIMTEKKGDEPIYTNTPDDMAKAATEARRRLAAEDDVLAPPPSYVDPRTQGVPRPGPEALGGTVSGEEFRARQFGGGYFPKPPTQGAPAPVDQAVLIDQWRAEGTTPTQQAIRAARAGDTAAQKALEKRGIPWRQ